MCTLGHSHVDIVHCFPYRTQKIPRKGRDVPFSTRMTCLSTYKVGERVKCRFDITNTQDNDYFILKWNTPLEGVKSSCLSITKDGKTLSYDGVKIRRGVPNSDNFILIHGGSTLSTNIDLSYAYAINTTGMYTVQFQSELQYCPVIGGLPCGKSTIRRMRNIAEVTSVATTFKLVGSGTAPKTLGEHYRQMSALDQVAHAPGRHTHGIPRDPLFVGGTSEERALTKEIHIASYHYLSIANKEIEADQSHYITWFGAVDSNRIRNVEKKFRQMKNALEKTVYTYHFGDRRCGRGVYAFTYIDSTHIYLCEKYHGSSDLYGVDSKLCTVVHEHTHARTGTNDYKYGRGSCKKLAITRPDRAINNADNYCYFIETTNPFDYGIDSVAKLPDGKVYATKGNFYLRYTNGSVSKIDTHHPKLIRGHWGALPDAFTAGFDSMATLRDGKVYVTKGGEYVRYSDSTASTVDNGYPKSIQGNWGTVPSSFSNGFDSMTVLPNNKLIVTKGDQYIRYSGTTTSKVDAGFPKLLQTKFGNLHAKFAAGFDSLAQLENGKTYATKGNKYIRYSDQHTSIVDAGYPLHIKGRWGTI